MKKSGDVGTIGTMFDRVLKAIREQKMEAGRRPYASPEPNVFRIGIETWRAVAQSAPPPYRPEVGKDGPPTIKIEGVDVIVDPEIPEGGAAVLRSIARIRL